MQAPGGAPDIGCAQILQCGPVDQFAQALQVAAIRGDAQRREPPNRAELAQKLLRLSG